MTTKSAVDRYVVHPLGVDDFICAEHPGYPCEDGEPMAESDFQAIPMTYMLGALRTLFGDRYDVYVAIDMFVYYIMGDASKRVAPDVFVVFGANGNHKRHSWLTWREGGVAPSFVLEVASSSTWERDAGEKRDIYAEMGVPEYWRLDPIGDFFSPVLVGERLVNGVYLPVEVSADRQGILRGRSEQLGVDICVRPDSELRLYDPSAGRWILNHQEEASARQVAEAARQAAEEENRRLREELAQLRRDR